MGKLHHIKKAIKQGRLERQSFSFYGCCVYRNRNGGYIVRNGYSRSYSRFLKKRYDEVAHSDNGAADKGKSNSSSTIGS